MEDKPLINRLLSGIVIFKLKGRYIQVKPAKVEDKAFADFYAQEVYEDSILEGILTEKDIDKLLLDRGWWSKEEEEQLKTLGDNLDQMKLDYYTNFFKIDTRNYIKKSIDRQTENINELYNKKNIFIDKTCEYIREFAKKSYLMSKCAFFENGDLVQDEIKSHLLINTFLLNALDDQKIRQISKNPTWRIVWNSREHCPIFQRNGCELTDEQLSLMGWARYYDSVYESMEKPANEIIDDDIAIDGWFIKQDRKRKEEEKKAEGEKMLPDNMQNAGEILIPVKSKREQENVLALNDTYGKSVLKSKKKQFAKGGTFNENELNHVKQEIHMEGLRQAKESRRR